MEYRFTPAFALRTIDFDREADLCAEHHFDACRASFGEACRYEGKETYLRWLKPKIDEFPEGFVLAFEGSECVGHLEVQVPYGNRVGYVNLFYIDPEYRGHGHGRILHEYAERYFRNWEANTVELHVSPRNIRAIRFYRKLGYQFAAAGNGTYMTHDAKLWKMSKTIGKEVDKHEARNSNHE